MKLLHLFPKINVKFQAYVGHLGPKNTAITLYLCNKDKNKILLFSKMINIELIEEGDLQLVQFSTVTNLLDARNDYSFPLFISLHLAFTILFFNYFKTWFHKFQQPPNLHTWSMNALCGRVE